LSVSRVGSAAQNKLMKSISGELKLYMASYKEALAFSLFSTDLDFDTVTLLNRGSKLTELLKQKNYTSVDADAQFVILYAGLSGLLDGIEISKISELESYILDKFQQFYFYDEDISVEQTKLQLTDSLRDVINE
jgi:F0F1-type ATP synthase alpha subunit